MKCQATLVCLLKECRVATGGEVVFKAPFPGVPPSPLLLLCHVEDWFGGHHFQDLHFIISRPMLIIMFSIPVLLWVLPFTSQSILAWLIQAVHPGLLYPACFSWLALPGPTLHLVQCGLLIQSVPCLSFMACFPASSFT